MSEPYIIFECGPTHRGYEDAKMLTAAAAQAAPEADAIKFQMIDAYRLCADYKQTVTYTDARGEQTEPLIEVLARRMLTPDHWRSLAKEAHAHGLDFILTCCYEDEVDFAVEIGADAIKIASGDIDQHDFMRYVATKDVDIHIDTGNATMREVLDAYNAIMTTGFDRDLVVHHCPTGYPARPDAVNLNIIGALVQRGIKTAYSCHTQGSHMCAAALALGATVIEKTLTMSRNTSGPEHIMSLEPQEAGLFVQTMRDVHTALGERDRTFTREQDQARRMVRRKMRNGVLSRPGV